MTTNQGSQNKSTSQTFLTTELQLLTEDVYRVILTAEAGFVPDYKAGQYLEIIVDGDAMAFSIASAPMPQQKTLELHIQKLPGKPNSEKLFSALESGNVQVIMAKGQCCLDTIPNRPLVFIAAGTGFAQMKSMIEFVLLSGQERDIHFYWGARSPEGFYMPSLPVQWSSTRLHYHPVVSDANEKDSWKGRQGLLFEAVIDDKDHLNGSEVFISGSPQMVYATYDALVEEGFDTEAFHSDVFEYAPRA
ncbi:hypothetical protein [Endozoicomonas ascidiicola]|uniref:hypothetical protein n=1 Tax=Endozoicomonas ascidiicola TaxID=1698521 RepID=UPI0008332D8A|nr:hypothetical protein [Endozoicomonas ascidiicola]